MIKLSVRARNAACDAVVDLVDAGNPSKPGKLRLYSGTRPANADIAPGVGNTLLAELTFADTGAFTAAGDPNADGTALANSLVPDTDVTAGTVTWFRVVDGDGNSLWDGDVTETDGGGDLELDEATLVEDGTVQADVITFAFPASCST